MLFCGSKYRILGFAVGAAGILCVSPDARSAPAGDTPASETCPSRDSIGVAVQSLLGESQLPSEELNLVEVVDLGDRYVIKVKGRVREYTDESRDCAKRARVAAVFVALTLAPPDIGASEDGPSPKPNASPAEPPPQASTSPPPAPPPPVQPVNAPVVPKLPATRSWAPGVEIGVSAAMAPRSDTTLFDLGGQFKFVFASPQWGLILGANIPTASTLLLESIRIQQARYSAILGVRLNLHTEQLRGALDICAMSALLRLRQLDLPTANTVTRVESGLHVGTTWALSGRLVSPYVGGYAEFIPATIPIAVEPRGIIGHSSAVWFGLSAGMALGWY